MQRAPRHLGRFGCGVGSVTVARHSRTMRIQLRVVTVALSIAFGSLCTACFDRRSADAQKPSAAVHSFKRMSDGKEWMTENLNVDTNGSYCYEGAELNCRRYGRLYTWESARRGCQSLGDGWRLPTDDEWRRLAKHYGGLLEDSADGAKATYRALVIGGTSGFNAMLGGSRVSGRYERVEAHGFYWTASDNGSASAPFYNFAKGGQGLSRHGQGQKQMGASVRCIKE